MNRTSIHAKTRVGQKYVDDDPYYTVYADKGINDDLTGYVNYAGHLYVIQDEETKLPICLRRRKDFEMVWDGAEPPIMLWNTQTGQPRHYLLSKDYWAYFYPEEKGKGKRRA